MPSFAIRSNIRECFSRFFFEEDGQATIEYILILSVLVTIAVLLVRDLIRPVMDRLSDSLTKRIETMFQPGESMHRLPFNR